MAEKNADGLTVRYFMDQAELANQGYHDIANRRSLVMEISTEQLWGTTHVGDRTISHLPKGAIIESAYLKVIETFTASGAATLTIGTYRDNAGTPTVVDADGIDATLALAVLVAGNVVKMDGAQVAAETATSTYLPYESWIVTAVGTGPYLTGKAVLVVNFVEDSIDNDDY